MAATEQFQQVLLCIANNGLVAVWKEMVSATMAKVKIKRIAGEQTAHQLLEINAIGAEQ